MLLELPVIRLQVQLDHMKPGLPPRRRYEPRILRQVAELRVTADGVIGIDGGDEYLDVHNAHHPRTRDAKGRNGISIMTTGDYAALRARYGAHVTDGIAGESLLLDYAPGLAGRAMPEEVVLLSAPSAGGAAEDGVIPAADGSPARLALVGVHIAKPCVEFSRFCLRRDDFEVNDDVTATLKDLDGGARGYKMAAAAAAVIRPGDLLTVDLGD